MSRSCDLGSSLRLGLPRTVTPSRRRAMDAKQRGCLLRIENDAELTQRCVDHCSATLMRRIGGDPFPNASACAPLSCDRRRGRSSAASSPFVAPCCSQR